jgi:hypothetical protein
MFFKSVTAAALLAMRATATIYYAGVAESGGEFGVYSTLRPFTSILKFEPSPHLADIGGNRLI